jgi:uncharacterized protein
VACGLQPRVTPATPNHHTTAKDRTMHALTITPLFVGLLALIQVLLTVHVIVRRAQTNIDWLDGGDQSLMRRIRAHGNFTETAPMALLAMGVAELSGLAPIWLWVGGSMLVVGRSLHAMSLLTNNAAWSRRGGMLSTLAVLLGFGLLASIRYGSA